MMFGLSVSAAFSHEGETDTIAPAAASWRKLRLFIRRISFGYLRLPFFCLLPGRVLSCLLTARV